MKLRMVPVSILCLLATTAISPSPAEQKPRNLEAEFPPIPPLTMYDEILGFRSKIEGMIAAQKPALTRSDSLTALIDRLVTAWDAYGDFMDREHGDFPNMSRNRPYWLITTDDAADTLTSRVGPLLALYVKAHPEEKLGQARVDWEIGAEQIGVPRNKLFGFQFVELARRGAILRRSLEQKYPEGKEDARDAFLRFLWDAYQFYAQLHSTWYDRNTMRVADEDWVIHRSRGLCKDSTNWQMVVSLTAIGVDTTSGDVMTDKFMHRLCLVDPKCGDTLDFVMPLPHYRLMEMELGKLTPGQRDSLLRGLARQMIERGKQNTAAPRPGDGKR